jgi:hypothetical protein
MEGQPNRARDEAVALLLEYNRWTRQTASYQAMREKHPVRDLKVTDERVALCAEMAAWCREREIDPRLWLFHLFRARRWTYKPKLERGHLMSENMVERYRKLQGFESFRKQQLKAGGADFDPLLDLDSTVEATKQQLLEAGQADRCRLQMTTKTLGFHPQSPVCQVCPEKEACRAALQERFPHFDVVEFRMLRAR